MITVAGFSGGAFMATQLHVIFSDDIKGAGLMNGGPFEAIYESHTITNMPIDHSDAFEKLP